MATSVSNITPGFDKSHRSSFKYWFSHWAAFQMTALNLRCWKFKYLFHDFEKPWLKLFMPYKKLQKIHRKNNRHHPEYRNKDRIDWEALVIDWECSRYTKIEAPLSARETLEEYIRIERFSPEITELMIVNIPPILEKLNL